MVDFNLEPDSPVVTDDVKLLLQQIDILFDTIPTEVFGDERFGTTYDRYLYNLKVSNEALRQEVLKDINSLETFGFTPEVEVLFLQGTEQDIALINITLTRYEEQYKKTYKIS